MGADSAKQANQLAQGSLRPPKEIPTTVSAPTRMPRSRLTSLPHDALHDDHNGLDLTMNKSHAYTLALVLAAASGTCTAADAPPSGASAAGGRPPGPPPEAVVACNGKTAGTTVSFTGRN